jgi:hypothetical protein
MRSVSKETVDEKTTPLNSHHGTELRWGVHLDKYKSLSLLFFSQFILSIFL